MKKTYYIYIYIYIYHIYIYIYVAWPYFVLCWAIWLIGFCPVAHATRAYADDASVPRVWINSTLQDTVGLKGQHLEKVEKGHAASTAAPTFCHDYTRMPCREIPCRE